MASAAILLNSSLDRETVPPGDGAGLRGSHDQRMVTLGPGIDPAAQSAALVSSAILPTTQPIPGARGFLARPRLAFFLPWLFRLAVVFGATEAVLAAVFNEPPFLAAAVLTTAFGGIVLIARRLVAVDRAREATWVVAITLGVVGFLGTLVLPDIEEAMALLPILAVALLLPYAAGQARWLIVALAVGSTALILIGGSFSKEIVGASTGGNLFASGVLVAISGLVIAALVDFWDNALRSLAALDSAVVRQQALSEERIALGRVLESLTPRATVDAAAWRAGRRRAAEQTARVRSVPLVYSCSCNYSISRARRLTCRSQSAAIPPTRRPTPGSPRPSISRPLNGRPRRCASGASRSRSPGTSTMPAG